MKPRSLVPLLVAIAGAAAVAGCHGRPSVFEPAGPAARDIGRLGAWVIITLSTVTTLMMVLIFKAATRNPGTLEEHAPHDVGGGHRWVQIGGFLIPAIVLFAIFGAALRSLDRFPLHDGEHYKPDIRVTARQWWWQVQYLSDSPDKQVTTANEIHIPTGWSVEIELESRDVIHSFWVPSLHGKVDLVPGQPNRIRIVADEAGRYEGQCAEYCGAEHTLMKFAVIAEPLAEYEKWLANEGAPAVHPTDPEGKHGEELFQAKACGLCHAVRGTPSMADVGPDLTHIAARKGIAANSYPNARGYLEAWITHAQSLKPAAEMPDIGMQGDDLHAITHYLEELN